MTHTEINKRIKEYERKLNSKRKVYVGKKTKLKGQPGHLKKYFKEEILKLTKLKESLENQKTQIINFSWNNIIFDDFKIHLTKSNIFYGPIQLKDSRKSFVHLKPYFNKLNLKPITCTVKGNEIIKFENLEEIYEIIQVFNFKTLISDFSNYLASDVEKNINKLNNKTIITLTNLANRSVYLKHLITKNHINFKIIPLLENGHNNEDSFIFTLKNNNNVYLVWESCINKKATYVFSTTTNKYLESLIEIVKFILSEQTTRMDLRQNFIRENMGNIKCNLIFHNEFNDWKNKIEKTTGNTVYN
ncbi:hypothetical protein [Psychroserpens damuponensis]|uniref:hypothetical protein n=1 Tax=Psychroserpens damuponensis TaxID=943936 RepID=UPI00058BCE5D|nr:hypothetical protein [Psychroserpens damuponensis]